LRVVATRRLPAHTQTRLAALFQFDAASNDVALSKALLIEAALQADVLVCTITDRIDREVIAAGAARSLKLIANYGAGTDHIDLDAAREFNILVTNTPGALTEDTADMTMAMVLALFRRMPEALDVMREERFEGWHPCWMLGRSVRGARLGILGLGRIGQAVAARARAFGMEIHYHNRKPVGAAISDALHARYWESLDQMLAHIDVLTVHCPHTPATFHLLSRRRLARMAPHAMVVNTARGEIIDEDALGDALHAGELAAAALDVFEDGAKVHPRLRSAPNTLLTPHIGSATQEARNAMGELLAINIRALQTGETPPHLILPDQL
jgi:glyoxylate reductase